VVWRKKPSYFLLC